MHLERLEIQGFKSFAKKNVLTFPDPKDGKRGITAVVGPNGSGKSNIADAVRWVLGEQSMKTLRGKKSEDIIFSGSDKKGKLGMAEVSLYLNNEDKDSLTPVQAKAKALKSAERGGSGDSKTPEPDDASLYSQIVLTRRLFREGESEYLLNGSRARLLDIQLLLAKASFGQHTYSVIGQGMVEGFLNTSLTERKEFFDEATGVKQFQIKRDDALNKLRASYENLNQARLLLDEISPRLKTLTRQVDKLKKRGEVEAELKKLQLEYYGRLWRELSGQYNNLNSRFLGLEKVKKEKEKKMEVLEREHAQFETEEKGKSELESLRRKLIGLQNDKDDLVRQLAQLEARTQVKLESQGKFDLSWLIGKIEEIKTELIKIEGERKIVIEKEKGAEREKINFGLELDKVRAEEKKLAEQISQTEKKGTHGAKQGWLGKINLIIAKIREKNELSDFGGLKKLLGEVMKDLEELLIFEEGGSQAGEKQGLRTSLDKSNVIKEEIQAKINRAELEWAVKKQAGEVLAERIGRMKNELGELEKKASDARAGDKDGRDREAYNKLKEKSQNINEAMTEARVKIEAQSKIEEEERKHIFKVQRSIQNLQNELNDLNGQLGELRVSSARFETRLEDLEKEIRQSSVEVREVKMFQGGDNEADETMPEKIGSLKRQLDLIGGLDPEIEKEYATTKERHDFLSEQAGDMSRAVLSLEKIIFELDANIKERFDKEFKIISSKFEEYFKILFNGGGAKIIKVVDTSGESKTDAVVLTEESGEKSQKAAGLGENELVAEKIKVKSANSVSGIEKIKYLQKHNATGLAGIEVQACPPGKKIRSISMLSGGERALTAIALICAIISANPSPFVILDEVDAALDEANSERLVKILDDLSHNTQFIVITHNRSSMRRANILYGVTMQDDGVSKLLSVKLEEAKAVV